MIPTIKRVTKQGQEGMDLFSWELLEKRRVRITGFIDDEQADKVMGSLQYLEDISSQEVEVIINSPGGNISSMLAILDVMKEMKSDIRCICAGECASAAVYLFTCGATPGKREIYPNAEIMIHQPSGVAQGRSGDVQVVSGHLANTEKKLIRLLSEATGQSVKKLSRDTERDKWMSANEAVTYGLADRVKGRDDDDVKKNS